MTNETTEGRFTLTHVLGRDSIIMVRKTRKPEHEVAVHTNSEVQIETGQEAGRARNP